MATFYSQPGNKLSVDDLYYDAMDLTSGRMDDLLKAEKLLKKALAMDEHNTQTHIGFAHVYGVLGNKKKDESHIKTAYEETIRKFRTWPKRMPWGDIDNRAHLRALQYRADLFADNGEKEKATELYKLLLKLNPNDNQGIRYSLSSLYAGISGDEINKMFDQCNRKQNWDDLERLVKEQNAKHRFWKEPK